MSAYLQSATNANYQTRRVGLKLLRDPYLGNFGKTRSKI
jgi:hypothetical protein